MNLDDLTPSTPWPPLQHRDHHQSVQVLDAWYSGSKARLMRAANIASGGMSRESSFVPRFLSGAFWGRAAGKPAEDRGKVHVPLAGEIAEHSSDLVFGTFPQITHATADPALVDELTGDTFQASALEAAETAAALGDVYLRPVVDLDLSPLPYLTVVQPDAAVPTFRDGRLVSVVFWSELDSGPLRGTVRFLEGHTVEGGRWTVRFALFAGGDETLGTRQSVAAHPDTAHLIDQPVVHPFPVLGVSHVPNKRPNRTARFSAYGQTDLTWLDGLDALDQTWTSWMRDIRLGQGRLVVPETYLQGSGRGAGQAFDVDRELFTTVAVPTLPTDRMLISAQQMAIRSQEHADTMTRLVRQLVSSAGYSSRDFGLDDLMGQAESGTALRVRRSRSLNTRDKKRRYWTPELKRSVSALLALAGTAANLLIDVQVEWAEQFDLAESSTTVGMLHAAEAASITERVRMVHPDWTDEQIDQEVQLLRDESGMPSPLTIDQLP